MRRIKGLKKSLLRRVKLTAANPGIDLKVNYITDLPFFLQHWAPWPARLQVLHPQVQLTS